MPTINRFFEEKLRVINLGLETFAESLQNAGAEVIHVDWTPPAGGDPEMMKILSLLKGDAE